MPHPAPAPGWIDRPHHDASIGDLPLESGAILRDCRISWVEHGQRNATGDNTILGCCAIGSTHHRLDFLIGPGRALDPSRHHVVVIDALGNGLSSSPSNHALQRGAAFPRITIRDMVESQRRLLEVLGIGRLHAVVGASMGGMQALQWGASHPTRMERIVAMTAMARTSRWSQLMNELSRRALFEDEAFSAPRSRDAAMSLWAPLTQLAIASTPAATERFADQEALLAEVARLKERLLSDAPDPFDWLCQTRAYDAHDLAGTPGAGGSTQSALETITAQTLLAAPALDLYNPPRELRAMTAALPQMTWLEIVSDRGHRAATDTSAEDAAFLNRAIREFLHP